MLTSWLCSVLNLLTFFRCTTIWLDLILVAFGVLSGWVLGLAITCLSAVAVIFNITVCVLERKTKKRTKALPPMKMSVICLDFLFGTCYLAAFVLELLRIVSYRMIMRVGDVATTAWTPSELTFMLAFSLLVSLHAWRQQRNGKGVQGNKDMEIEQGYVMDLGPQVDATAVQPKTPKE